MRFAVISDVQGNVSALQAVLVALDADSGRIDRIISAGDAVGLGPYPNEVLELFREREIEAIRGNYDDAVAFDRESAVDFPDTRSEEADRRAVRWTRQSLSPANLSYLQELPHDVRLLPALSGVQVKRDQEDQQLSDYRRNFFARALFGGLVRSAPRTGRRILVVHGSPRSTSELVRGDTANSILSTIAGEAQADVIISGHGGRSFQRETPQATFIGVGGVSGPYAVSGEAEYAIIEISDRITSDFNRASYDPTRYLQAIDAAGLPPPRPAWLNGSLL